MLLPDWADWETVMLPLDWADWETGLLLPDYDLTIWFIPSHREGVRGAEVPNTLTNHSAMGPLITACELRQL